MSLVYWGAGMGDPWERTLSHFQKGTGPARMFPPGFDEATGVYAHKLVLHIVCIVGAGSVLSSVVTGDVEKGGYELMLLGPDVYFVNGKGEGGEGIEGINARGYCYLWTQDCELSGAENKFVPPGFIPSHNGAPPVRRGAEATCCCRAASMAAMLLVQVLLAHLAARLCLSSSRECLIP